MFKEYLDGISRDRFLEHVAKLTEIATERLSGSEEEGKFVYFFNSVHRRIKV